MPILQILLTLVVICLVFWAVRALLAAFGIGDPIATVIYVVLVIFVVVWIINLLGGGVLLGHMRWQ
jgi:hypothetical protein